MTATWQAADGASSYDVQHRITSASWAVENIASIAGVTTTITNLGPGDYQVRVRSVGDEAGAWSAPETVTETGVTLGVPVIDLYIGDGSITVDWVAVPSATAYDVRWGITESGATTFSGSQQVTGATQYTIMMLTNDQEYGLQVRAVRNDVEGNWSTLLSGTPMVAAVAVLPTRGPTPQPPPPPDTCSEESGSNAICIDVLVHASPDVAGRSGFEDGEYGNANPTRFTIGDEAYRLIAFYSHADGMVLGFTGTTEACAAMQASLVRLEVGAEMYTSDRFSYSNGGCRVSVDANPFSGMLSETVKSVLRFHQAASIPGTTAGDDLHDTVCGAINDGLGQGWCVSLVTGIGMIMGGLLGLVFRSTITIILGGTIGAALGVGLSSGSLVIPIIIIMLVLGCGALFKIFRR